MYNLIHRRLATPTAALIFDLITMTLCSPQGTASVKVSEANAPKVIDRRFSKIVHRRCEAQGAKTVQRSGEDNDIFALHLRCTANRNGVEVHKP